MSATKRAGFFPNKDALPEASPANIKAARTQAGLTQQAAAELVHRKDRARWREWESGRHHMDTAVWELFLVKARLRAITPDNRSD